MINISNQPITKLAEMALTKPDDFGYWGYEDMFITWGFTGIDKHRDSGVLDRSNFEIISRDLMRRFPDDFRIEGYGHWAVGHVDRLTCRILKERGDAIEENITDAFKAALEWHESLDLYPVADEMHHSEMEFQECIEILEQIPNDLLMMINTSEPYWAERIYDELQNMYVDFYPDSGIYPKDNEILIAVYNIGLWNEENLDEWEEFCLENNLQYPPKRKNPNQLNLFEEN